MPFEETHYAQETQSMKAVLIPKTGPADVLEYVDVDTPVAGPGHLLVKIAAIGTGFGDVMQRMGLYPHMPPLPFITGHEASGVVTSVGDGVDAGWIGQRVVILSPGGCYAEYAICPEPFAARLPDSVSDTVGAALAVNYLTAHYLLHRTATLAAGDTIVFINADTIPEDADFFFEFINHWHLGQTKFKNAEALACTVNPLETNLGIKDKLFYAFYNRYVHFLNIIGSGMGRGEC